MSGLLPFIVFGVVAGSVYGLAAMGLVLTYKTSGLFNFGQGGIAAAAAFAYYALHVQHGVPAPVALFLAVPAFGVVVGLALEVLARRLATVATAEKIVATIGILLVCQAGSIAVFGGRQHEFPNFLPTASFRVAGTGIRADQVITTAIALAAVVGLSVFFRISRLGTAMRAVVDDPDLLDLTGTGPAAVRRVAWIIGTTFAALSGLLIAPVLGLDATLLTLLIVQAFGAAAVGAFTSLPLAYVGGLLVGLLANILPKYTSNVHALNGLPLSVPFLVLFVALLVTPTRKLKEAGLAVRIRVAAPGRSAAASVKRVSIGLIVLVLVPFVVGSKLPVYLNGLTYVVLFASLGLLVRTSGQVSLCHIGFQAVGAAVFTHLTALPWGVAVLLAGLATVPLGVIVAVPAMRLSGLFLALATFGFGILLQYLVYDNGILFGQNGGRAAPRPHVRVVGLQLASDRGYYFVLLAFVVGVLAFVVGLERARLGRLLRALADSPVALATHGTGVNTTRVLVFVISAFLAGVSGALVGPLQGVIDQVRFNYFNSLVVLAVLSIAVVLGRTRTVGAAFLSAAALAVVPAYIQSARFNDVLPVLFGAGAIVAALGPRVHARARTTRRRRLDEDRSPVRTRTERSLSPTVLEAS